MKHAMFTLLVLTLSTAPAIVEAEEIAIGLHRRQAKPDEPPLTALTIVPAAEPRPVLRYTLVPKTRERTPGNAAPIYLRALLMHEGGPNWSQTYQDKLNEWLHQPLDASRLDEIRKALPAGNSEFAEAQRASRRETCHWENRLQDLRGEEVFAYLLPELQPMRGLARLVAIRSRLEIAEGRYDDAIRTLQVGFQLAHDVAEGPTLVHDLVGAAIATVMNDRLVELMQSPGAPNLYWAIADLPTPLVDVLPGLRYEADSGLRAFPFLLDAETAARSPDEWNKLMPGTIRLTTDFSGRRLPWTTSSLFPPLAMMKLYPEAKRALVDSGMPTANVEAMPVGQVVAIQTVRQWESWSQEMLKSALLPYPVGQREAETAEKNLRDSTQGSILKLEGSLPLAQLLLPAVRAGRTATMRLQRDLAALSVVAAIQMYTAEHNGRLPESLADIHAVPVPENPMTGQPFGYRLEGGTAILDGPADADDAEPRLGLRLKIRVATAGGREK